MQLISLLHSNFPPKGTQFDFESVHSCNSIMPFGGTKCIPNIHTVSFEWTKIVRFAPINKDKIASVSSGFEELMDCSQCSYGFISNLAVSSQLLFLAQSSDQIIWTKHDYRVFIPNGNRCNLEAVRISIYWHFPSTGPNWEQMILDTVRSPGCTVISRLPAKITGTSKVHNHHGSPKASVHIQPEPLPLVNLQLLWSSDGV